MNKSLRLSLVILLFAYSSPAQQAVKLINPVRLEDVKIDDPFWSPKLKVWDKKTVYDVFDKFEGKYEPDRKDLIDEKNKLGHTRNTLSNFDRVAKGDKDTKQFDGLPWFDGLLYESIRGASDLLIEYPDPVLEKRIDGYIDHIAAAQAVDANGYINTYTSLNRSGQPFGTNDGDDVWQHDIYNAGMLVEAGIHYYNATGKVKLLAVATKLSNYMYDQMGPAPKINMIPGHGGPEEALVKLYWLYKNNPDLKNKVGVPVDESQYYKLANFWIEARGNYGANDGTHARKSFHHYGQDQMSVFEQRTIEGHAVRATLLATGVAASAVESKDPRYITTADNYWNNMIGKRMFITGGEGAISKEEKFGPDYYLPESSYLETCAAIGAGFFTQRMNQLHADGKYMDEFERIIYNNLLSGVSLAGDKYFYENPLIATEHRRWAWHDCPCCPPMFLKMVGVLPSYIYATGESSIYVNLFIASEATVKANENNKVSLKQETQYPWKGKSVVRINPEKPEEFTVNVRIPGWATGKENPYDLYTSAVKESPSVKVNGKDVPMQVANGYVAIKRKWNKGDMIELNLPVQPRLVFPNDAVKELKNKMAIAAGPVIYCVEGVDNPGVMGYTFDRNMPMTMTYSADLLNGVNTISGSAAGADAKQVKFKAIPFYSVANRELAPYKVWLPVK